MQRTSTHCRAAALAVTALLFVPATSEAAHISRSGDRLHYVANSGEANDLAISTAANQIVFRERGGVSITSGCGLGRAAAEATCSLAGVARVLVSLEDGRNIVTSSVADLDITDYSIVAATTSFGNDIRHSGPLGATILGSDSADRLEGGFGADRIDGRGGNDQLLPLKGNDLVDGGAGSDVVSYAARAVPIKVTLDSADNDGSAGERANVLTSNEQLIGGAAGDTLIGTAVADRLSGGPGADTIRGGGGTDTLNGDAGTDDLFGDDAIDFLNGGADDDDVIGGADDDQLFGAAGRDIVSGGDGNDFVAGDTDGDLLLDGPGRDVLSGGPGDDLLRPLAPGAADRATARGEGDVLAGDEGVDTVDYGPRTGAVTADIDDVADDGEALERDRITTTVEDLAGGSGGDVLTGSAGPNTIRGFLGADVIDGGAGRDELRGDRDGDTVRSQDGEQDLVDCGLGADLLTADAFDATVFCGPEAEPDEGRTERPPSEEQRRAGGQLLEVAIAPRVVRVGADGRVALRVTCLRGARRACDGTVRLAGARRAIHVDSGATDTIRLVLPERTRESLRRSGRLRASAQASVSDTFGRHWTVRRRVTLEA